VNRYRLAEEGAPGGALRLMARGMAFLLAALTISGCAASQANREQADRHVNIGSAYLQAAQYNPALKELLDEEKLVPDDPKIHYLLGIAYQGKGLREKAADEFRKALELKPDYSEASNYLGMVYFDMGQFEKAIAAFQAALSNVLYDTPSVALYNMGKAYQKLGNVEMALAKYAEATQRDPNSSLVPLIDRDIALILYARGDYARAIEHLKRAVDRVPAFVEAHYWLGESYLKVRDSARAAAAFRGVVAYGADTEFGAKARQRLEQLKGR